MRKKITVFAFATVLSLSALAESPQVVMNTTMGEIVVELNEEKAPVTVANFLTYVDDKAYDGSIFHRVIPGFMIQGGGHTEDMTELPDSGEIKNEADNGLKNVTGSIAMARTESIDSASRQFFINVADNDFLDHSPESCTRADEQARFDAEERGLTKPMTCKSFGYAVFGQVVEGMDIVYDIEIVPTHTYMWYNDVPQEAVTITSIRRAGSDSP